MNTAGKHSFCYSQHHNFQQSDQLKTSNATMYAHKTAVEICHSSIEPMPEMLLWRQCHVPYSNTYFKWVRWACLHYTYA